MRSLAQFIGTIALFLAVSLTSTLQAQARVEDAEQLVVKSEFTVKNMWDHPEFANYVRHYLRQSKAVVVIPSMLKGGFLIGGEGGSGILMARGANNEWSYPAFLSIGSASFGLQFGGQSSEMLLIVMTGRGLQAILDDQVQIGGEISGAIGPYGSGAEASTTSNMDADVIAYSISKGAFLGFNVEGTALVPRESLNREYYGQSVSPSEIVLKGVVGNPQADQLRQTLKELMTKQ